MKMIKMEMWEAKQYAKICGYLVLFALMLYASVSLMDYWPPWGWMCTVYCAISACDCVGRGLIRKMNAYRRSGIEEMDDLDNLSGEVK